MLFNLEKCLIMHSGFEETGMKVRLMMRDANC